MKKCKLYMYICTGKIKLEEIFCNSDLKTCNEPIDNRVFDCQVRCQYLDENLYSLGVLFEVHIVHHVHHSLTEVFLHLQGQLFHIFWGQLDKVPLQNLQTHQNKQ